MITETLQGLIGILMMFVFCTIAKMGRDHFGSFNADEEIEEKSNMAVALRRAGVYLGTILALMGTLGGESRGFGNDLIVMVVEGAVATLLLIVAGYFTDDIIIPNFNDDVAVKEGNVAVGLVEFGNYVATGLILWGAFAGDGATSLLRGIGQAVVFFALGEALLLASVKAYEQVLKFNVREHLIGGNESAGLMMAGAFITNAIILRSAIAGPFVSWTTDTLSIIAWGAGGLVISLIFQWLVDLVFLPNTTINVEICRDRNSGAVALTVAMMVGIGIAVSTAIL